MEESQTGNFEVATSFENKPFFRRFSPIKGRPFLFLFVVLGILALGSGFLAFNNFRDGEGNNREKKENQIGRHISDNVIVYGYWADNNSVIALHNLADGSSGVLALLPINIKHVRITSPNSLIFISETDARDHGKAIVQRNLESSLDTVLYTAEPGFGIDDYVVSSNSKYLSVWEIELPLETEVLTGGRSRVYNYDVETRRKYLIYDEPFHPGVAVHYPIGITDLGNLFTDKFMANSGAGWAHGMSVSNLTGSQKSDILGMTNGTYSSQPVMSPDGRYIAFAGYSGENGTVEKNGFRTALSNPNTVEVFSTTDMVRKVVKENKEGFMYPSVIWDKTLPSNLLFTQSILSETDFSFSQFQFNPEINLEVNIISPIDSMENQNGISYASLSGNSYLLAKREVKEEFMGNLGEKYARSFKDFTVLKKPGNNIINIALDKTPVQLIDVKNSAFFSPNLISTIISNNQKQLQLKTFVIKHTLAPKREIQQSNPVAEVPFVGVPPAGPPPEPCIDGQPYQTARQCYGIACGDRLLAACNGNQACEENNKTNYIADDGTCTDSPLYLYGKEGQKVSVQIGVPLYSPNIPYSPEKGVEAEISADGFFYANGKLIEGFSFDYTPGIKKIQRPEYGEIVARSDLEKKLKDYALRLGLNTKEKTDLLKEVEKINSNYQYVSFFDHETSHKILPLYFTPKPDTYRNIVFYIEEFNTKPDFKPKPHVFEKIKREGLTAIEISVFKR